MILTNKITKICWVLCCLYTYVEWTYPLKSINVLIVDKPVMLDWLYCSIINRNFCFLSLDFYILNILLLFLNCHQSKISNFQSRVSGLLEDRQRGVEHLPALLRVLRPPQRPSASRPKRRDLRFSAEKDGRLQSRKSRWR